MRSRNATLSKRNTTHHAKPECLANGDRAKFVVIGNFTEQQFQEINAYRTSTGLPPLEQNEILYMAGITTTAGQGGW
uniref:Uncharacterized protein n=1 Tax=Kingella kingae KKC2005004457 TaxID=1229911 RepID=T0M8C0_KINKI|nr:hypothetical protein C297_p00310 [Kingella kingae KKC2005004457]